MFKDFCDISCRHHYPSVFSYSSVEHLIVVSSFRGKETETADTIDTQMHVIDYIAYEPINNSPQMKALVYVIGDVGGKTARSSQAPMI